MVEADAPEERKRTGGITPEAKFDLSKMLGGKIGLELSLSPEDRELLTTQIVKKIEEMGDKVDYRWKITQWLMVAAIGLSAVAQVISWLLAK